MMHFSCDLCGRDLSGKEVARYVVRMEVFPAQPAEAEVLNDPDHDPLETMHAMLSDLSEEELNAPVPTPVYTQLRYDLCGKCHARFVRNPLRRDATQKLNFSEN